MRFQDFKKKPFLALAALLPINHAMFFVQNIDRGELIKQRATALVRHPGTGNHREA